MNFYNEEFLKLGEIKIYSEKEEKLINELYEKQKNILEESLIWQNLLLSQLKTK